MKNILKIALFALWGLVLITGCNKDNEEETNNNQNSELVKHLLGTWECVASYESYASESHRDEKLGMIWQFLSDGTLKGPFDGNTETATFSVEGKDILKITSGYVDPETIYYTISYLSDGYLHIYSNDDDENDGYDWYEEFEFNRVN